MGANQIWSASSIGTWPPIRLLVFISELLDNLESNCNIYADDTSLFYKVFDKHVSRATLSKDVQLINNCAFQWKMQFNADRNKQTQELCFSKKTGSQNHQILLLIRVMWLQILL